MTTIPRKRRGPGLFEATQPGPGTASESEPAAAAPAPVTPGMKSRDKKKKGAAAPAQEKARRGRGRPRLEPPAAAAGETIVPTTLRIYDGDIHWIEDQVRALIRAGAPRSTTSAQVVRALLRAFRDAGVDLSAAAGPAVEESVAQLVRKRLQ